MKKIAFIYSWPNTPFKNAEYEVLKRIEIAAKNIGQQMDIISSNGYILDTEFYETDKKICEDDYEFMVSVHYDDIKKLDIFTYHALWVPPEITLRYDIYPSVKKNILSYDDYLIYDDGGQSDHLKTILIDSPRCLEGCSKLYPTPPISAAIKPKLNNPRLFYCGINWEKLIGDVPRHSGLFHLLDTVDWVDIFGPENMWTGYKTYRSKIPFDGVSMLKEINNSGVVLSISSNVHYRAGAVTNRMYEAAAGGAVIISDRNRFVEKIFGNSVLYFDFDKENQEHMFNQIKQHMEWIRTHKEEALKLAEKSQQIFIKQLGQEQVLKDLISNHEDRKKAVAKALYSQNEKTKTLTVAFFDDIKWLKNTENKIINTINNINRQYEKNVVLYFVVNEKLKSKVESVLSKNPVSVKFNLLYVKFYDEFKNKLVTRGQKLFEIISKEKHDYLLILSGIEYLFKDHITTLKRQLEDNKNASVVYSGYSYAWGYNKFEIMPEDFYLDIGRFLPNGMFLIKSDIEKYIPEYVFSNLDGAELYAFVNVAYFKYNEQIIFSKRMTAREQKDLIICDNPALPFAYQTRMVDGINLFELEKRRINTSLYRMNFLLKSIRKVYVFVMNILIYYHKIRKLFIFSKKKRIIITNRVKSFKGRCQSVELF